MYEIVKTIASESYREIKEALQSRASIGGGRGGDASPPHFSGWVDSIGIVPPPPTFQVRKIARHIA